jgi:CheY-like chemotaxis protein
MEIKSKNEITILIVEDDEGHSILIRENLKNAGVFNPIKNFYNGKEVCDFLQENIINSDNGKSYLMLLDIKMPKMDGIEVLKKLKGDPKLKSIPVIMLTTTDDPVEIQTCYNLGCNAYITKPVEFNSFVETLKRLGLFLMIINVSKIE